MSDSLDDDFFKVYFIAECGFDHYGTVDVESRMSISCLLQLWFWCWSVSWWLLIFSYGFAWILVHGTQYVFPQSYSNIPTGAIPLSWMYKVLMHHWATAHCFYMSKAAKWLTYHPFVCVFNMVRVLSHLLLLSFISLLSCCRSSLWYSQPKI